MSDRKKMKAEDLEGPHNLCQHLLSPRGMFRTRSTALNCQGGINGSTPPGLASSWRAFPLYFRGGGGEAEVVMEMETKNGPPRMATLN